MLKTNHYGLFSVTEPREAFPRIGIGRLGFGVRSEREEEGEEEGKEE